jgi:ribosome-associated translation inhibitor RaiA
MADTRGAAFALMLLSAAAPVLAQEKSQQNAADEATVKGDLGKVKDSVDQAAINEAEKKLEQAAKEAKRKTDEKAAAESTGEAAAPAREPVK